ncbi:MAG: hypothetical protein EAZ55_00065 [Cytophagales bacterium]|nr:MAG: hypothetical protein EAZ55_00065 [Cytophagales bacterium]
MDSTKNFFDAWVNTQNKIVDNLVDTSKKLKENLSNNEVVGKAVEMYYQWLEKQKGTLQEIAQHLSQQPNNTQISSVLSNWLEAQTQFGQQWLQSIQQIAGNNTPQNFSKMQETWNAITNQFMNQFGKPIQDLSYTPGNLTKDVFQTMIDGSRTYMKMFELWQPIYKFLQSNTLGMESLGKMVDMGKYQEILAGLFQNTVPFAQGNLSEQMQKMMAMMQGGLSNLGNINPTQIPQQIAKMMDYLRPSSLNTGMEMLNNLGGQATERFNKMFAPYYTMIPASKEKEMLQLAIQVYEHYSKYTIKAVEMQNIVITTGQKSMENVVKNLIIKVREKAQNITFDEFYNTWIDSIERDMIALFASTIYSKLQGELINISLAMKTKTDKLMELVLSPLPIVPRSEVDEINATIYELKKKVRELEDKLEEKENTTIQTTQVNTTNNTANTQAETETQTPPAVRAIKNGKQEVASPKTRKTNSKTNNK